MPTAAPQLTQVQAGYLPSGPFRCDHCVFFRAPAGCAVVAGRIRPGGCCNGWQDRAGRNRYGFAGGKAFERVIKSLLRR